MATDRTSFTCPNCNALYQIVRQEAGPETSNRDITCRACGGPLPARDGRSVLKYFVMHEGGLIEGTARLAERRRDLPSNAA
jgi:predicted RNA-binding Zn-ribbon protein involved in translation (DUF1610 family)